MGRFTGIVFFLLLPALAAYAQESHQIDLSEIEKEIAKVADKPYSFGGFFELQPTLFGLDRDSAFARVRFLGDRPRALSDQHNFRLRLQGSYKKDIFSVFFKTDTHLQNAFDRWNEETRLFEAYASVKPTPSLVLEAGKKPMKWGKGYAWNPASFIDRPKNPEDPEEALEGATVATADYIRSFDGPLKTVTLTAAAIPVYRHVNSEFGELYHTNFASKLYLLLYDTDIDFMFFTGGSRTTRYGFDFARNLTTNFAIHGEWSLIHDQKTAVIDREGRMSTRESDAVSYLLGLRYLTERETTYILEYYRNGTGFSRREMKDFFGFVEDSYKTFVATGDDSGLSRGRQVADGPYGRPNPGRHYLYFRVSQKEPFDILYLTPALTSIINVRDGSLSLIPEIAYSPVTNLDLRFRTAFLVGKKRTDYGEKQNDYRIEFRLRYHFGF